MIRKSSALIIVDMQNDFMPWGALPVKDANLIISIILKLAEHFNHIIATQDWHPEDHISFALNHGKKPGEIIEVHHEKQVLWPAHCVQNTLGADLAPPLKKLKIEKIFYKGSNSFIDSYSAFFDNAKKKSTGLGEFLRSTKIKELFFAGVATDYCVKYSVLDAIELGFSVSVIKNACKGINLQPGDEEKAFEEMKAAGAKLVNL